MTIEICEGTKVSICTVAVCAAVVAIAFMIYRYNAIAFEQGYTQKQLENSQVTMWVKE